MIWLQRTLELPKQSRGLRPITAAIVRALPELPQIGVGLLNVFLQHTSASVLITENADPDVLDDLDRVFDTLAPEDFPYKHTAEGPDDMPAHVKAALTGSSLTVPIRHGQLALGVWQGIYLYEHRDRASGRHVMLTLQGESGSP